MEWSYLKLDDSYLKHLLKTLNSKHLIGARRKHGRVGDEGTFGDQSSAERKGRESEDKGAKDM
jgi:hypothetical protein